MFDKMLRYAKAAFFNQWHLLALGGATIFALICPLTGLVLPLVIAAEILFMSFVIHDPRFQRAIDAEFNGKILEEKTKESAEKYNRLYQYLNRDAKSSFEALRERCSIINKAVPHIESDGLDKMAENQSNSVNKLLWVYLKLLHTRQFIKELLDKIDEATIEDAEKATKKKIDEVLKENLVSKDRMIRSLQDTLGTIQSRKLNLVKARENFTYIGLELDRISAKLTALSEMAVNRQDPLSITGGIDDIANSVQTTEEAIGELNHFAGLLTVEDEAIPSIIERRQENGIRVRL